MTVNKRNKSIINISLILSSLGVVENFYLFSIFMAYRPAEHTSIFGLTLRFMQKSRSADNIFLGGENTRNRI